MYKRQNLATATLTVTYNPDIVSPQQLKEAVMKIGFDLIKMCIRDRLNWFRGYL